MKVINQICRILTAVLGLCALVLYFFPFVSLPVVSGAVELTGANMAFGTAVADAAGKSYDLQVSSYIVFTFVLAAFATLMAIVAVFSKKGNGARIASFISAGISGVVMLVIALSKVIKFADIRPITVASPASLAYEPIVLITALVILATFVIGVVSWLVNDYILVLASKGQRVSIFGKVVNFFREMAAEIRKIVWPGPKSVLRNSIIVLIICAILGAFIWIVDFLLGSVVNFITTL